jgi:hypothetical protein
MARRRVVKVCDGSGGILQIATGRCEKRQESEQHCCDHRIRPSYVERCMVRSVCVSAMLTCISSIAQNGKRIQDSHALR